jgi:hypothetical protein
VSLAVEQWTMRLWSLHPRYLDTRGLVALWREALLAQAVLAGSTRGYTKHPQLVRFRQCADPLAAIGYYLKIVHAEATARGFRFAAEKIGKLPDDDNLEPIVVARGQLEYEWAHLQVKLRLRAPQWLDRFSGVTLPEPHALFRLAPGPVAPWEGSRGANAGLQ